MTAKPSADDQWPLPLVDKPGQLGDAVRAYARSTGQAGGKSADFADVVARMARRPRRAPVIALGVAVGILATATAAFLMVGGRPRGPSPNDVVTTAPPTASSAPPGVTESARPTAPSSARASIVLRDQPVALPAGETDLVAKATARLSPDAAASGRTHHGVTEVALQRGELELQVLPQAPGQSLVVVAGRHRFTVVGTVFTLSRRQTRIALRVQEGAVAVSRGTRQLALVKAGGRWHVDEANEPVALRQPATTALPLDAPGPGPFPISPPVPLAPPATAVVEGALGPFPPVAIQPVPVPSPPSPPSAGPIRPAPEDCRQFATAGRMQEAVGCYQQQSARNGLAGETAGYELGRLWRDSLGQPDRAVDAFEAQRARFPSGALRREADLSIIELLPRLGRHADALAESQRFLSAHPGDERQGEIHLLRGNIHREVFRDLSRAQLEYALGAVAKGRAGDDSRFFHAVCLEALGKTEEARAAYQAYLGRRGGAHSAEASARLAKLAP